MSSSVVSSVQKYSRGAVGGLLFSLPLLYTMEAWWTGFIARPLALLCLVIGTFVLLLGYNVYAGIRYDQTYREVVIDSVEEMGLGLLIATALLWLLGRITWDMTWHEIAGKVIVEAMAVAIGVSVGTAQLGGAEADVDADGEDDTNRPVSDSYWGQVVIAFCGAVLLAGNIAPTEEIMVIALESTVWKLLALAGLSMVLGGVILYYANFVGAEHAVASNFTEICRDVVTMYAIALLAAALMLWFFGRFADPALDLWIAQTIVLGAAATLGASAGRLLMQ
jgi:putative integral membrane protein (TIGR02587 family)